MSNHFWLGSLCLFQGRSQLPPGIASVGDTITILEDFGNRIPDKSWMLYLLELFDRKGGVPVELNLICQFNDRDNFWAIFGGTNRHKFTSVLPVVGHTYLRQIIFRKESRRIEYVVTDKTAGKSENFLFEPDDIAFEGKSSFSTWMYRVAVNTAITFLRKEKRQPILVTETENLPELRTDDHASEQAQQMKIFYKAVQYLNSIEKALIFYFMEGLSHREIGSQLGITENNARVKLSRTKGFPGD